MAPSAWPERSSSSRWQGFQPVRAVADPDCSSASRKAWLTNGLKGWPGGLASPSQMACGNSAMPFSTRAVSVSLVVPFIAAETPRR